MEIKRYKDFINEYHGFNDPEKEHRRSVNIEYDGSMIDYIKERAPWYLENIDNIMPIYRGLKGGKYADNRIIEVQPSKFTRGAANTYSHYIELMDNSPYWKDYPKRSKSIVCSTDWRKAWGYKHGRGGGAVYRVIPIKENEKFGVCPKDDVFVSFPVFKQFMLDNFYGKSFQKYNPHKVKVYNLDTFIEKLVYYFDLYKINSYEDIKKQMEIAKDSTEYPMKSAFSDYTLNPANVFEDILKAMSPEANGFELINYNRNTQKSPTPLSKEVWTEADCILVEDKEFQKELKEYGNKEV
jgi:hypothetical protein